MNWKSKESRIKELKRVRKRGTEVEEEKTKKGRRKGGDNYEQVCRKGKGLPAAAVHS